MLKQDYSHKVRTLRLELGLTQHTLAERLHVRPQVVASWEQGRKEPSANSYQQLARLAPPQDAWFFLEKLGVTKELVQSKWLEQVRDSSAGPGSSPGLQERNRDLAAPPPLPIADQGLRTLVQIPILRDAAAGRHPSDLRPGDIESVIALQENSVPKGAGAYTGIYIRGDAMKPTLCDRFVAVIDHTNREAAALAGRLVAARLGEAVLIRRLAPPSGAKLVLRADNVEYAEISIARAPSNPIIGDVIFWWGTQG